MTKEKKRLKGALIRKFVYAFYGIKTSLKEEKSLVIHSFAAAAAIILAGALKVNTTGWAIIVICIGLIMGLELINTAIENVVDMVAFKYNFNAKKIKDVAAAATLILALAALAAGLLVFIPQIILIAHEGYANV